MSQLKHPTWSPQTFYQLLLFHISYLRRQYIYRVQMFQKLVAEERISEVMPSIVFVSGCGGLLAVPCGGPTTGWLNERRIPHLTVGLNHSCMLAHSYSNGNILKFIYFK